MYFYFSKAKRPLNLFVNKSLKILLHKEKQKRSKWEDIKTIVIMYFYFSKAKRPLNLFVSKSLKILLHKEE